MAQVLSYLTSAFFFRRALREAKSQLEAVEIGLHICQEHEMLREWCRAQGLIPPRWFVTPIERAERAAGSVVRFPTTAPGPAPDHRSGPSPGPSSSAAAL